MAPAGVRRRGSRLDYFSYIDWVNQRDVTMLDQLFRLGVRTIVRYGSCSRTSPPGTTPPLHELARVLVPSGFSEPLAPLGRDVLAGLQAA